MGETAGRENAKEESKTEKGDLETQVKDDEKFIEETQQALDDKKKEWSARLKLRTGELAAISKAIQVLRSDEARDVFEKSHASQGYFLLQESHSNRAAAALRRAAALASDGRLATLAQMV